MRACTIKQAEHCLGPLSNFEVVGMRRELRDVELYKLNVLEIKLNSNLQAQVEILACSCRQIFVLACAAAVAP